MSLARSQFIANRWCEGGGEVFSSRDSATGDVVWEGRAAGREEVDEAVGATREALAGWGEVSMGERAGYLRRFGAELGRRKGEMAEVISRETGKPLWESVGEVQSMMGKIELSIEAAKERRGEREIELGGARGVTRYKPHGVVAVLGPFNMPGHLPNGHIVPALLAGNGVVFKPSEWTPGVGEKMVAMWEAAGLPRGVMNLVQGGRETGAWLAGHEGVDGLFFTGSEEAGRALNKAFAERPGKILALELGGNNPLVAWEVGDLEAAAYLTIQSAFITAGQRCSCARRLIVSKGKEGEALVERLAEMMRGVKVGVWTERPEPFMGPVISERAAEKLLGAQEALVRRGGRSVVRMERLGRAMLSPGLVEVTGVEERVDEELFGPLLQVIRAEDFEIAVGEANRTRFGLAAGLLSDNAGLWERFYRRIRAGVVYWNRQTTGASGRLPFGGVGASGNHRPSGYWAADYCSYPVAVMEQGEVRMPKERAPGIGGESEEVGNGEVGKRR